MSTQGKKLKVEEEPAFPNLATGLLPTTKPSEKFKPGDFDGNFSTTVLDPKKNTALRFARFDRKLVMSW